MLHIYVLQEIPRENNSLALVPSCSILYNYKYKTNTSVTRNRTTRSILVAQIAASTLDLIEWTHKLGPVQGRRAAGEHVQGWSGGRGGALAGSA